MVSSSVISNETGTFCDDKTPAAVEYVKGLVEALSSTRDCGSRVGGIAHVIQPRERKQTCKYLGEYGIA